MNKHHSFFPLLAANTLVFGLASCGNKPNNKVGSLEEAKTFVSSNYMDFTVGSPASLIAGADGYSNNGVFGTTWSKDNMLYDHDTGMSLLLDVAKDTSEIKTASGDPYIGAEMRSAMNFQYGFFGTYMKPSATPGTASTFFLYNDNPHDEIDIEFLGKDTTVVQFNYFVNDVGNHEYKYNLGFDASKEYHHYGFYWDEHEITWYVDMKPVYRIVGDDMPSAPSKLMANHWAGASNNKGIIDWMGKVDVTKCPSNCYYKNIEVSTKEGKAMDVKPRIKEYDICPSDDKLVAKPISFKDVTAYTVDHSRTDGFEVTYKKEDITSDYRCVRYTVGDIAENRFVQFKIKNLNTEADYPALCRLTMDAKTSASSAQTPFKNIWKNGESSTSAVLKNNNLEAHYEVAPGEEATLTFQWYGAGVNAMTFMFDDFGACKTINGVGQRDGHLLISDVKFGGTQDYVAEDTSGEVDEIYSIEKIEDPESQQAPIPEGFNKITPAFGPDGSYQSSQKEDGLHVSYDVKDNNYQQLTWSGSNIFNGARELIIVLKNENPKEEHYQLKIKSTEGLVESCEVMSDASTGRFERFSGSNPGIPYVYVSAERTCQFRLKLKGDARQFAIVAAVGGKATKGSFILKGIYGKAA